MLNHMESLDLTPEQERKFGDMMSLLLWKAPGFNYIAYKMLSTNEKNGLSNSMPVVTREIDTAATDGQNVMINPDWFFKLNLPEMAFVYGHEVLHGIFGDVEFKHRCHTSGKVPMSDGTSLPFDDETFEHSADYRNNALLSKSRIGTMPTCGLLDPKMDGSEALVDIYAKEYKKKFGGGKQPDDGQGSKPSPTSNGGKFDKLLKPGAGTGQDAASAQSSRNEGAWQMAVASAEHLQKSHSDDMSPGMKRMFEMILTPEVPWQDHIRTLINRLGGSGGYDWERPDPWFAIHEFYSPKRTGKGARHIVVGGDTSGSRSAKEIASTIGEIAGIIEDVNPQRLSVVWWDTSIYVEELEQSADLRELNPRGFGGTNIRPFYEWVNKLDQKPDVLIVFTDGEMDFPTPPTDVPIIWASSTDVTYPYGDVVRVLKKTSP